MDGRVRAHVQPGLTVLVERKQDQGSSRRTRGVVARVLTRSARHPHGIKVQLQDGQVGRVKEIVEDAGAADGSR